VIIEVLLGFIIVLIFYAFIIKDDLWSLELRIIHLEGEITELKYDRDYVLKYINEKEKENNDGSGTLTDRVQECKNKMENKT
jgi:hypothetical protein